MTTVVDNMSSNVNDDKIFIIDFQFYTIKKNQINTYWIKEFAIKDVKTKNITHKVIYCPFIVETHLDFCGLKNVKGSTSMRQLIKIIKDFILLSKGNITFALVGHQKKIILEKILSSFMEIDDKVQIINGEKRIKALKKFTGVSGCEHTKLNQHKYFCALRNINIISEELDYILENEI